MWAISVVSAALSLLFNIGLSINKLPLHIACYPDSISTMIFFLHGRLLVCLFLIAKIHRAVEFPIYNKVCGGVQLFPTLDFYHQAFLIYQRDILTLSYTNQKVFKYWTAQVPIRFHHKPCLQGAYRQIQAKEVVVSGRELSFQR